MFLGKCLCDFFFFDYWFYGAFVDAESGWRSGFMTLGHITVFFHVIYFRDLINFSKEKKLISLGFDHVID